jgi:hypothetical protein
MSILKQRHHGVRCVYLRIIESGTEESKLKNNLYDNSMVFMRCNIRSRL